MYAKLYGQVVASSLTQNESIVVRGVFFMLLAVADKGGNVPGVDAAIARIINVPMDVFVESIDRLMRPDPLSQSKDEDGRRVVRLDETPGYRVVNYEKYSAITTDAQRRAYFRHKKAESRARLDGGSSASTKDGKIGPGATGVAIHGIRGGVRKTNRPAKLATVIEHGSITGVPEGDCKEFWEHYEARAQEGANGETVWVTGGEHPQAVGSWTNLLTSWMTKKRERTQRESMRKGVSTVSDEERKEILDHLQKTIRNGEPGEDV